MRFIDDCSQSFWNGFNDTFCLDERAFRSMLDELCDLIQQGKLTAPACTEVGLQDYSKALNAAMQPFASAKQVLMMWAHDCLLINWAVSIVVGNQQNQKWGSKPGFLVQAVWNNVTLAHCRALKLHAKHCLVMKALQKSFGFQSNYTECYVIYINRSKWSIVFKSVSLLVATWRTNKTRCTEPALLQLHLIPCSCCRSGSL